MRDRIKKAEYFVGNIQKIQGYISLFETATRERASLKGENDIGVYNGYTSMVAYYQRLINMQYSVGENIHTIKENFQNLLSCYSKVWNRNYGYIELIKVLSLAFLLKVDPKELDLLVKRIRLEEFDDYLVNLLLKEIGADWEKDGQQFEFDGIYNSLKNIMESDSMESCDLLELYLRQEWYDIHRECVWYNTHKSKQNLYDGYWSFEAGAIAKIKKIDDANMKNLAFYPYDLVHYEE